MALELPRKPADCYPLTLVVQAIIARAKRPGYEAIAILNCLFQVVLFQYGYQGFSLAIVSSCILWNDLVLFIVVIFKKHLVIVLV